MSIRQNAEDPRTVRRRGIRPHSETIMPSKGVMSPIASAKKTMLAVVPPPSTPSETPKVAEPTPKAPEAQKPRINPKKTMLGLPPAPSATPAETKPTTAPTTETKATEPVKHGPPPPPRRDGNFNDSIILVPIENDAPTTPQEEEMQFRNCSTNGLGAPPNPDGVSEQTRAAEKALRDSIRGISGAPAPGDVTPPPRGSQPDMDPEEMVKTRAMEAVRRDGDLIMPEDVQIGLAEDALKRAKEATDADVDGIRNDALRNLERSGTAKTARFIYRRVVEICDQRFPSKRRSPAPPPRRGSSSSPPATRPLPPPPNPPSIPGRSPARHSSPPPARPPMPSDPAAPLPRFPGMTAYFDNPNTPPPAPSTKAETPPPAGKVTAPEVPDEPSVAGACLPPPPTTPSVRTAKTDGQVGIAFPRVHGMTSIITETMLVEWAGALFKTAATSGDLETLKEIQRAVGADMGSNRSAKVMQAYAGVITFVSGRIQALEAPPPPPAAPAPKARKKDRGPVVVIAVCVMAIIAASAWVYSIPTPPPQTPDASENVWGN